MVITPLANNKILYEKNVVPFAIFNTLTFKIAGGSNTNTGFL